MGVGNSYMDMRCCKSPDEPVVSITNRLLANGMTRTVSELQSAVGLIGPTRDLINEGTIKISGDVLFLCKGDKNLVSMSGTVIVEGDGVLILQDI